MPREAKSVPGEMRVWRELAKENDLAAWLVMRYRSEKWLDSLGQRWGVTGRMIRYIVEGQRLPRADVLYTMSKDTGIPMEKIWEQCYLWKHRSRKGV